MTVPELTDNEFEPIVAVTVELLQVVATKGAAELLICGGYVSTKAALKVAETS